MNKFEIIERGIVAMVKLDLGDKGFGGLLTPC